MSDRWGVADGYHALDGTWQQTSAATKEALHAAMGEPQAGPPLWFVALGERHPLHSRCVLELEGGTAAEEIDVLPGDVPIGYHVLRPCDGGPATQLFVQPRSCPEPPDAWGVAAQLYAMWTERSWGIGDLGDLAVLTDWCASSGVGAVLLSPLHAPALAGTIEPSPYYPSSRQFMNPLHIGMQERPPAGLCIEPSRPIDRDAVWAAKHPRLVAAFATMTASERDAFERWRHQQPAALARYGTWCAIADELGPAWRRWPSELRRPGPAVHSWVAATSERAGAAAFHEWTQWVAATQLTAAARAGVALIGDLAVGFDPEGFDSWALQDMLADGVVLGAPPDDFNTEGQVWNVPPLVPWRLRAAAYEPFATTVRLALAGMQGLRIDHVMGMFRQFWVPQGGSPADGGYVYFPAEEILAVLTIEAHRAGAFLVGEDLGVVEPSVRVALRERGIAGTRVLWFAEEPPQRWDRLSLATVTTHDLPTVIGVHTGRDGSEEMRCRLRQLVSAEATPAEAVVAAHRALAAAPSLLRLATLDDLALATERPNVPGTTGADRTNWSIPLPAALDDVLASQVAKDVAAALA